MNSKELLIMLSKQWCSLNDMMKICNCEKKQSNRNKKIILDNLLSEGYIIHSKYLPTEAVVDYLKINID